MFASEAVPEKREVHVERILFASEDGDFHVVRVVPEREGAAFVAAGAFPIGLAEGQPLLLEGFSEEHPRFGPRFRVVSARPRRPEHPDGIRRYLASGRVTGIGRKLAARLVSHFGADTLRILDEEPERLREVPGVGRARAEELARARRADREEEEALVFLQGLGLGPRRALAVYKKHGTGTIAAVSRDPYALIASVPGMGFSGADALAREMGLAEDAPARLRAALVQTLIAALDQGHLHLPDEELAERAGERSGLAPERLHLAIRDLVARGGLVALRPRLPEYADHPGTCIYLPRTALRERRLAETLLLLAAAEDPPLPGPAFAERVHPSGPPLSTDQRQALATILASRVALLTGGPGVGKTTVQRAVADAWEAAGLRIALAAPTGRAARRLAESTGRRTSTLHRLFGLAPGRHDVDGPPLEADALVIDEASMLDLPLLDVVVARLAPGTILLLVGDPDQLPPVGPGAVFEDLLASRRFPTVRLTKVFRQAAESHIIRAAHEVLAGRLPEFEENAPRGDAFLVAREDPAEGARLVEELFLRRIPRRFGLDPTRDVQILAPMHRGTAGVSALNARIQRALGADRPRVTAGREFLCAGDRVVKLRNDAERDLMNGELGVIESVDAEAQAVAARFDGGLHRHAGAELKELAPAWATTIHKAQGSEYPAVILVLFREHFPMLRRSVLYTAMTRARRLLVVVGARRALELAVRDTRTTPRRGLFRHRLMGHPIDPVD